MEASEGWYISQEMSGYAAVTSRPQNSVAYNHESLLLTHAACPSQCLPSPPHLALGPRLLEQLLSGTSTISQQWKLAGGKTTHWFSRLLSRNDVPHSHPCLVGPSKSRGAHEVRQNKDSKEYQRKAPRIDIDHDISRRGSPIHPGEGKQIFPGQHSLPQLGSWQWLWLTPIRDAGRQD